MPVIHAQQTYKCEVCGYDILITEWSPSAAAIAALARIAHDRAQDESLRAIEWNRAYVITVIDGVNNKVSRWSVVRTVTATECA